MPDAFAIGEQILERLDRGRLTAIENAKRRAESLRAAIESLARDDIARGRPDRGRAGRIAGKLRGLAKRRTVQKYLASLGLLCQIPGLASSQQIKRSDAA